MGTLNDLKKDVFYRLLDVAGRVFVLVRHSEGVRIGRRGFLDHEKENGIVLVFNGGMNFKWDESGIGATLVFGAAAEKCFIPADDILAVYSPDLGAQFVVSAAVERKEKKEAEIPLRGDEKLVRVDFTRKK